jgi:hypothetical protein
MEEGSLTLGSRRQGFRNYSALTRMAGVYDRYLGGHSVVEPIFLPSALLRTGWLRRAACDEAPRRFFVLVKTDAERGW